MELTLIRGLPGSGKSTYAQKLGCFHIEADMYFIRDGQYNFNPGSKSLAHVWCQKTTFEAMKQGLDVVVSNTFTEIWELAPYIERAKKLGYNIKIICMTGEYRTIHSVPDAVLEKMKNRWEPIQGEVLI